MWGGKLIKYLDDHHVKYVRLSHSPAYTAQEVAAAVHISGRAVAKTVVVKLDGRLALAVLPASEQVDLELLRAATGSRRVDLATEREFASRFPECEQGAMPPFGNLYGLPVHVADSLAEDLEIAFNACSFTEVIRMSYEDFARLAEPTVLHLSAPVAV